MATARLAGRCLGVAARRAWSGCQINGELDPRPRQAGEPGVCGGYRSALATPPHLWVRPRLHGRARPTQAAKVIALLVVAVATLLVIAWIALPPLLHARRRHRLAATALPAARRRLLAQALPLYARLPAPMAGRLEAQLQVFLHEKRFIGCGGFHIDERARLTIAGNACLLRLQPRAACYPEVREVLVYPSAFWVRHDQPDEHGLVDETPDLLAGEAWDSGRVVLSWQDIEETLAGGPTNVVAHEFAHQIDFESPGSTGAPQLPDYAEWTRVFTREFEQLRAAGSPVLDAYGAENPAEFFAVATETFIQRGGELACHHPELYRLLRDYFLIETAGQVQEG